MERNRGSVFIQFHNTTQIYTRQQKEQRNQASHHATLFESVIAGGQNTASVSWRPPETKQNATSNEMSPSIHQRLKTNIITNRSHGRQRRRRHDDSHATIRKDGESYVPRNSTFAKSPRPRGRAPYVPEPAIPFSLRRSKGDCLLAQHGQVPYRAV